MSRWDEVKAELDEWEPKAIQSINEAVKHINSYSRYNDNPQMLSQVLSALNYQVMVLGDLQSRYKKMQLWTEKRYEIEKGLEKSRIVNEENKSAAFADGAKYNKVQDYLDTMVQAAAMFMRVQNARSSARDTTEAIRSRISQLKDNLRGANG